MNTKQVRQHKKDRGKKKVKKSKRERKEEEEEKKKKRKRKKETQGSRLLSFDVCRKCTYPRGKVDAGSEWVPG